MQSDAGYVKSHEGVPGNEEEIYRRADHSNPTNPTEDVKQREVY
ncbi:hypothetical protein M899_0564 [Bacteriovorax sp. BSW11_IV]|nr:hypothetical protein M899_0564 [Bacteriovorax sp. BSW11_IV]